MNSTNKKKWIAGFIVLGTIVIIWGILSSTATNQEPEVVQDVAQPETPQDPSVDPVPYKIVSQDESSAKAMGGKSLSSFSSQELSRLPVNKKILYRVVVSPDIKPEEIRPTMEKIVTDMRATDRDIDEIGIFMYSSESLATGAWDIASAMWGVDGKFGGVTPEIASGNVRSGYSITIKTK